MPHDMTQCAHAVGFTGQGYDAIPLSADPGQQLQKRSASDQGTVIPDLQKRAGFSIPSNAQTKVIKDLIGMWAAAGVDQDTKQVSMHIYCSHCTQGHTINRETRMEG